MAQQIIILIAFIAAFAFFSLRLFYALRDGRIWVAGIWPPTIEKHSSPWNYWVALLIQAVLAGGFIVGIVVQLRKLCAQCPTSALHWTPGRRCVCILRLTGRAPVRANVWRNAQCLMAKPLEYKKLPSGKEIFRTFEPGGSLVREQHSYGPLDIGITYVFSGGAKIEET